MTNQRPTGADESHSLPGPSKRVPARSIIPTEQTSFASFYEVVMERPFSPIEDGYLEQARQIVHEKLMLPTRKFSGKSEEKMQWATPPLVRVGPIMLEDTSHGAKRYNQLGDTYAADEKARTFERYCFRLHETMYPDLTGRLPVTNDPELLLERGEELDRGLPAYRLMPYNIASFVDYKQDSNPLDSNKTIDQLVEYTDGLLRSDFRRRAAFAAATNGRKVMFVCTRFMHGSTRVLCSEVIDDANGRELATFLATAPHLLADELNWTRFPVDLCQPLEAVGWGSSGFVMEVHILAHFVNYFAGTDVTDIWKGAHVTAARLLLLSAFSMLRLVAIEKPGASRPADNLFAWKDFSLRLPDGWAQLLTYLQKFGEHDDEVEELLQSPQRVESPISWARTAEERMFNKVICQHPDRGASFLAAMREEGWNESVILKCSEESRSLEWEARCLQWIATHMPNAACPRLVDLERLTTSNELRSFAFHDGRTRVVAMRPRFARLTAPVSRRMLTNAWALLSQIHAVGLIHCDIRRPNMMCDAATKQPVFIDWGYARFHCADTYVEGEILEEVQAQRAHMLEDGLASTRMGLITASSAVLLAAGLGQDVPLEFPMYPADDAVALIKLGIQMIEKKNDVLQVAPLHGVDADSTWRIVLRRPRYESVDATITRITEVRDTVTRDELNTLVAEAIAALPIGA